MVACATLLAELAADQQGHLHQKFTAARTGRVRTSIASLADTRRLFESAYTVVFCI